jgi:glycopeptide antibiotics resistance protein
VLSPFNFTLKDVVVNWHVFALSPGTEDDLEIMLNILLYIPFGFGLARYFFDCSKKFKILLSVVVICFALSYTFEVLQSFLPSRHPSWRDVASNTLGGMFGVVGTFLWKRKNTTQLLVAYLVAAYLICMVIQRTTTLKNWNGSYPLLVGNEHSGDRPWKGIVPEFYIASRAASAEEVMRLFDDNNPQLSFFDSLAVYYKKAESNGYLDEIGTSPPLMARKGGARSRDSEKHTWFETAEPVSRLTDLLARSSQFTLGAKISFDCKVSRVFTTVQRRLKIFCLAYSFPIPAFWPLVSF